MPAHTTVRGRIVVGVDGSPGSTIALRWAITRAHLDNATIDAISTWQDPSTTSYGYGSSLLSVDGHPAQVLLAATVGARLLVLGSRGHGTFAGILLGSVSQRCIQHASCPVVVVATTDSVVLRHPVPGGDSARLPGPRPGVR